MEFAAIDLSKDRLTLMLMAPDDKVDEFGEAFISDRIARIARIHALIAILVDHKDAKVAVIDAAIFAQRPGKFNSVPLEEEVQAGVFDVPDSVKSDLCHPLVKQDRLNPHRFDVINLTEVVEVGVSVEHID